MSMPRGKKVVGGYSTVVADDGENYRTIADQMTLLGHKMNHASARNYVLRAMRKFAYAISKAKGEPRTEVELEEISRSPVFQSGIAELIQRITFEAHDDQD